MTNPAKVYSLDVPSYISVEYPMKVNDVERATSMVGGSDKIAQCFIDPEVSLQLKLRPDDRYSHPISSAKVTPGENVLLKVRVPKRLLQEHHGDIRATLKECQEKEKKYEIEPVGLLGKTFRFRSLADFQVLPRSSQFTQNFEKSLNVGDLSEIKSFAADIKREFDSKQSYDNIDMDIPPLVRYARTDVPFNYRYSGNLLLDSKGEWQNKAVKLHTIFVNWGDPPPQTYDPVLQEEYEKAVKDYAELKETQRPQLADETPVFFFLECIKLLRKLFDMKPVWLRRHIHWMLPEKFRTQLRYALPYVAYTTTKGPWRQSFIRFGYDPAHDPNAAIYQVEAFRSNRNHVTDDEVKSMIDTDEDICIIPRTLSEYTKEFEDPDSEINKLHIGKVPRQFFFDGEHPATVVSFQVGDIVDADVDRILSTSKLEPSCGEGSGWYDWKTICRLRSVVKYKLSCINEGQPISEDEVQKRIRKGDFSKNQYAHVKRSEDVADDDQDDRDEDDEPAKPTDGPSNDDLLGRLKQFDPNGASVVEKLKGLVNQEDVMEIGWGGND